VERLKNLSHLPHLPAWLGESESEVCSQAEHTGGSAEGSEIGETEGHVINQKPTKEKKGAVLLFDLDKAGNASLLSS
jgi:hypothetical protein